MSEQFKDLPLGEDSEKKLLCHPQAHCVVRIRELFSSLHSTQVPNILMNTTLSLDVALLITLHMPGIKLYTWIICMTAVSHAVLYVFGCMVINTPTGYLVLKVLHYLHI